MKEGEAVQYILSMTGSTQERRIEREGGVLTRIENVKLSLNEAGKSSKGSFSLATDKQQVEMREVGTEREGSC